MQVKTTKDILAESFQELAQVHPINKITIAQITANCGMTSPTFYRYFKDKYDLIMWIYLIDSEKFMGQIGCNGYTWRDTLRDGLQYFARNRKYAINALKHTSGRDSFIEQKTRLDLAYISRLIQKKLMKETVPEDLLMITRMYLYGVECYLCEWLVDGMPLAWEKVAEMMEECVPEKLRPFLYE